MHPLYQNETLSYPMRKNEDTDVKEEEDIEYENVEYLDDAKTDCNSQHNIITKEYNY